MAEAAFRIGALADGNAHVLGDADMDRGVLVRGGGATGKTSALLSMFGSVVDSGRGCVFVDGKADARTLAAIVAGASGRVGDLIHLDLAGDDPARDTSTCNPFAWMTGRAMADLVMPAGDAVGRVPPLARFLVGATMGALAFLRDRGLVDLEARTVREHLSLRRVIDLSDDNKYPEMPARIRADLSSGLRMVAAYQDVKGYMQSEATKAAFMQVTVHAMPVLDAMCADDAVFGHASGDVDVRDVAGRGRILVVTLPPVGTARADAMATLAFRLVSCLADGVASDAERRGAAFPVILDEALGHERDEAATMLSRCGVGGVAVVASSRAGLDGAGWSFAGTRISLPGDVGHGSATGRGDGAGPRIGEYRFLRDGHAVEGRLDRHAVAGRAPGLPPTVGVDLAAFVGRTVEDPFEGDDADGGSQWVETARHLFPEASARVDATDAVRRAIAAAHSVGGVVTAARARALAEAKRGHGAGEAGRHPDDPSGEYLASFLNGLDGVKATGYPSPDEAGKGSGPLGGREGGNGNG